MAGKILTPKHGQVHVRLYSPHSAQRKMHQSKARFRVAPCGRRAGKTSFGVNEGANLALNEPNSPIVWIAPVYRQCKVVYRLLRRALRDVISYHSDTDLRLEFINGSTWEFYSATNPDAMRGNKWKLAIFDETADILSSVWTDIIRPALADMQGRAIFLGTPKGRNWFWKLFLRGNDPLEPEWESFTFPTSANPYIPKSEIEAAKKDLPEDIFEQEFLARFLEESAGAFRKIDQCIIGISKEHEELYEQDFLDPEPHVPYAIGWDVARAKDYSVFSVLNILSMRLVAWARFNIVDYPEQVERCKILSQLYNNAPVLMDATGVGDAVYSMAREAGVNVEPFVYTNTTKKDLWEELIGCIQNRGIEFPNIPVMVGELRAAVYKYTPAKRLVTYEASPHDDCINSLALAKRLAGDGASIGIAVASSNPTKLQSLQQADTSGMMYTERDYNNPELMKRQQQVASILGDVELIAQFGSDY